MELLHRFWSTGDFTLPQFELTPLEFDPEVDEAGDELLLDEIVSDNGPGPRAAPPERTIPTAGELRASIELHLGAARQSARSLDAADELRDALMQVRRSLA